MMYRFAMLLLACPAIAIAAPVDDAFFESKIRPVLAESCFKCHGGDKESGKLRVDGREALIKGGETGAAIVPGEPEKSLLIRAIRRTDDDVAMPPSKKQALSAATVKDFEAWIQAGAPWPAKAAPLKGEKHWAFEPLKRVTPPGEPGDGKSNPIDAFINTKLAEKKITPAGRADKRTLIRRATFDLTGLPPTPEEVAAFLADDSPEAFAKVVDRLLASPRYGERWGRHWLDVVRYADSAGETADFPLPHAWRYRNYVIDAFNADKPYDQFLREQIAGDIIAAKDPAISNERYSELVTATGYIAIARRFGFDIEADHFLTIDDTIDTLGRSVLGLAIGCARCHDHKYDPISAADYYALYGIFDSTRYPFSGCEKTPRSRDMMTLASPSEIERVVQPFRQQLAAMDESIRKLGESRGTVAGQLKKEHAAATTPIAKDEIAEGGKAAFGAEEQSPLKRVAVKKGQMIQFVLLPKTNHGGDTTRIDLKISELGGKTRVWDVTQDVIGDFLAGNPHADHMGNAGVWCFLDPRTGPVLMLETLRDFQGQKGLNIWRSGDTPSAVVNASDVVINVWTPLPPRSFFAHPAPDGPVTIGWISPIDGEVSIAGEIADAHPNNGDGVAWTIDTVGADLAAAFAKLADANKAIADAKKKREEFAKNEPRHPVAYAVTEGKPHHVPIFVRGDPMTRGEIVPRRFLSHFGGQLVPDDAGSGRLQLAQWLTTRDNPLTARVMVNRIWQHHFGHGLVRTPSDFGLRGLPPSHPELLDYLATRFADEKWSIKAMHRLIMSSEAYQRANAIAADSTASTNPQSAGANPLIDDAANTLLWRFDRRRLSAEEIRDAILAVSGDLDLTPAEGHAFPAENTWSFTQHTPFAAVYEHNKRSVYLMTQRLKRHPFLTLFDGADTAASTDQRHTSTMPTQALFFLNDPFVHARATSLAARLMAMPDDAARIDRLFRAMYGRPASKAESDRASAFIAGYARSLTDVPAADRTKTAWAAWVRVMFGSNEFLYVD